MQHQVVWVDIPVVDLERAMAFYSAVLDAKVTKEGGPGFVFGLLPHEGDSVSGCLYQPSDNANAPSKIGPLVYLNAAGRLDEALAIVHQKGGQVLQAKHQIGPHGWRAIIIDSEGNKLALHAPAA